MCPDEDLRLVVKSVKVSEGDKVKYSITRADGGNRGAKSLVVTSGEYVVTKNDLEKSSRRDKSLAQVKRKRKGRIAIKIKPDKVSGKKQASMHNY